MRLPLPCVLLAITAACARPVTDRTDASPSPSPAACVAAVPAPPAPAASSRPPLQPASWIEPLPGGAGFLSAPMGAREARPVVLGVHGNGDRPDWACSEWRAIFGPGPFIVCPSGTPIDAAASAFAWRGPDALKGAIGRALAAVDAMYPGYAAPPPRVYAGFSRGASVGAAIVEAAPSEYPYAIFLEGYGDLATARFTRAFHAGGGKRILLGCSQAGCEAPRRPIVAALSKAGIDAKITYAGNIGHTVNPAVVASVQRELGWLLAGEAWPTP